MLSPFERRVSSIYIQKFSRFHAFMYFRDVFFAQLCVLELFNDSKLCVSVEIVIVLC